MCSFFESVVAAMFEDKIAISTNISLKRERGLGTWGLLLFKSKMPPICLKTHLVTKVTVSLRRGSRLERWLSS